MTLTWYPAPTDAQAADQVTEAFVAAYHREPDGVWAAPGRVNLIGEHVDYNAGLCLPFALPHRTFVALGTRDDAVARVRTSQQLDGAAQWVGALDQIAPGSVEGWPAYAVGVPWALAADGYSVPGFDAVVDGYVPLASGLSSSAALECAVAVALDDVAGWGLSSSDTGRARLAAACVHAENDIAGAPTGGLDQTASLRSAAGQAVLIDCRDFSVQQLPFDLASLDLALLVIDTRAQHAHSDGQYGARRSDCEAAAKVLGVASLREIGPQRLPAALHRVAQLIDDSALAAQIQRRVRHVSTEIERVSQVAQMLRAGDAGSIGPLLDASHASLRDDYEVSCRELDVACSAAVEAGARGARMTGGGFGGSAIALVEARRCDAVAQAVAAAFATEGLREPAFLTAVPSAPAGRVG